jgi:hypothetical protein
MGGKRKYNLSKRQRALQAKKLCTGPPATETETAQSPSTPPPPDISDLVSSIPSPLPPPPPPPPVFSDFVIWEDKENVDPLAGPGRRLSREPLTVVTLPTETQAEPLESSPESGAEDS